MRVKLPLGRGIVVGFRPAYPVSRLGSAVKGNWAPGDTGYDDVSALPIGRVEVHTEGGKAFQTLHFGIPEVSDSRATDAGKCVAFVPTTETQRSVLLIGDERVPKYGLPE